MSKLERARTTLVEAQCQWRMLRQVKRFLPGPHRQKMITSRRRIRSRAASGSSYSSPCAEGTQRPQFARAGAPAMDAVAPSSAARQGALPT